MRIRRQHDFEEQGGRIRWSAGGIVPESRIEGAEIDGVLQEMVDRMLERAGEELPRQVDGQELGLRIDLLVAGHGREGRFPLLRRPPHVVPNLLPGPGGLRRSDRQRKITQDFFYSLVRRKVILIIAPE